MRKNTKKPQERELSRGSAFLYKEDEDKRIRFLAFEAKEIRRAFPRPAKSFHLLNFSKK